MIVNDYTAEAETMSIGWRV